MSSFKNNYINASTLAAYDDDLQFESDPICRRAPFSQQQFIEITAAANHNAAIINNYNRYNSQINYIESDSDLDAQLAQVDEMQIAVSPSKHNFPTNWNETIK
jgi:hypothetical protein